MDRFWSKVNKHGPRAGRLGRCWLWMGNRSRQGYGRLGKRLATHIAWGDVPDGMNVLHRCDNPPCVRRSHLFLGTQADNLRDAVQKGRVVGWNSTKQTDQHGHPYDYDVPGRPHRICRRCQSDSNRRSYERRRAGAA